MNASQLHCPFLCTWVLHEQNSVWTSAAIVIITSLQHSGNYRKDKNSHCCSHDRRKLMLAEILVWLTLSQESDLS